VVRTHDARSIEEISALEHVVDSGVPCSPVASTSAQDAVFEPLNESSTVQIDESVTIDGQQVLFLNVLYLFISGNIAVCFEMTF
jgi:hypothetical protein